MIGLERFKKHFKGFENSYVVIGGTACEVLFEQNGENFRSTKDIDMVIIMENISQEFVKKFWDFINEAKYESIFGDDEKKKFYRFTHPKNELYPKMIELFSRKPIHFELHYQSHLLPIHVGDEVSSLSAILLNKEYYQFLKEGITIVDGLPILDELHLIPFKAKAYVEIKERVANGEQGQSRHIKKHQNDILKLLTLVPRNQKVNLSGIVLEDMVKFIEDIKSKEILSNVLTKEEVIQLLSNIYTLS